MKLLLDMDGVLISFIDGVFNYYNKPSPYKPNEQGPWDLFTAIGESEDVFWRDVATEDWWASLNKTDEADEIVETCIEAVGAESIWILTSPPKTNKAAAICGKEKSLKTHFPYFYKTNRVLYGSAKEACASPFSLLVDDSEKNLVNFVQSGGHIARINRPWNKGYNCHPTIELKGQLESFAKVCKVFEERIAKNNF